MSGEILFATHRALSTLPSEVTPPMRLVLLVLANYAGLRDGARPSLERLATETGLCRRAVAKATLALEKAGLIRRSTVPGVSTTYTLTLPEADPCTKDTSAPNAPVHDVHQCTPCTGPVHDMHGTSAPGAPETLRDSQETLRERAPETPTPEPKPVATPTPTTPEPTSRPRRDADDAVPGRRAKPPKLKTRCPASTDIGAAEWCSERGIPSPDENREVAKMLNHHAAAGSQFVRWDAAWSKWLGNVPLFSRGQPPPSTPKPKAPPLNPEPLFRKVAS